jgi:hypothetical protein
MGRPGAENGSRKAAAVAQYCRFLAFCAEGDMNFGIPRRCREICRRRMKERCSDATKFILQQWFSTDEPSHYIYQKLHKYKT